MTETLGTPEDSAEDVTDLRQAQRIIAGLRHELVVLGEASERLANDYRVMLDDERAAKVEVLFEQRKLFAEQDDTWELEEAFGEFVRGWIDVQWDLVQMDEPEAPTVALSA